MASAHETAVEALRTVLASITAGGGYVYTPDSVKRVSVYDPEITLDVSLTTIYLIRPGNEERKIVNQGCHVECNLEVFVLAAQRFNEATEDPQQTSGPLRWQRTADMVADILAKINADTTLGVGVPTGAGPVVDVFGTDVDYERELATWAIAEIRLMIRYRYLRQGER